MGRTPRTMVTTAVVGLVSVSLVACSGKSHKDKRSATATTASSVATTVDLATPTTFGVGLGTTTVPTSSTTSTTRVATTTTTRTGSTPADDTASISLATIPDIVTAGQSIQVVVKVTKQAHAIGEITLDFGDGSSVTASQQYSPTWKPCVRGNTPLTMPFDHTYTAAGTYHVKATSPACDPAYPKLERTFDLLVVPAGTTTTTVTPETSTTSSTTSTSLP